MNEWILIGLNSKLSYSQLCFASYLTSSYTEGICIYSHRCMSPDLMTQKWSLQLNIISNIITRHWIARESQGTPTGNTVPTIGLSKRIGLL